jgi:hypothetical protein
LIVSDGPIRCHYPDLRLRDLLADPALGEHVRNMRLGDLIGAPSAAPRTNGATRRRFAQRKSIAVAKTAGTKPSHGKVNTRTAAGRGAKVLGAIVNAKGAPVSASDVRKIVGGDPLQFRASADRLVRAKKIKSEGNARGTRYCAR